MSRPLVEDGSRDCPYSPCTGRMEPELDGSLTVWVCTSCGGEFYGARQAPAQDTCQMGLPIDTQQVSQPDGPVFLGPTIGRRPE